MPSSLEATRRPTETRASTPVANTPDYDGRMKTMWTRKNFATYIGPAPTTWHDDTPLGLLAAVISADPSSVTHSKALKVRLAQRTLARGVIIDSTYTNAGELVGITYSDSTPTVAAV